MSKECNIVADLLPLYQDGVCTEDSRELVETHLAGCASCRKLAEKLAAEITAPAKAEEIDALKGIKKRFNKKQKKAFLIGISATLAVFLLLFAAHCTWWYTHEYRRYAPFAEGKTRSEEYDDNVLLYTWCDEQYEYDVLVPHFLEWGGSVTMRRTIGNDQEEPEGVYEPESVYIGRVGGEYVFSVVVNTADGPKNFVVDRDLNYYEGLSDEDPSQAELEANKDAVQQLVNDAIKAWPFLGE